MASKDFVYAWGSYVTGGGEINAQPQLLSQVGTGVGGSAVTNVDADASFLAVIAAGVAYGYGDNSGNQINQTATTPQVTPQQIGSASNGGAGFGWGGNTPIQTKGGANGWQWLDSAGNVWFVGSGGNGVHGQNVSGNGASPYLTPVQVKGVGGTGTLTAKAVYGAIAMGSSHACALLATGTVVAWGDNTYGEAGDGGGTVGTPAEYDAPHAVVSLTNIAFVSCGNKHCIALDTSGAVHGWGQNTLGQLGIGNNTNQTTPQPMQTPWATAHPGTTIVAVSAGGGTDGSDGQTFMIDSRGNLWGTGANASGQLAIAAGGGPQSSYNTPQLIMGPDATNGNPTAIVYAATSGGNHGMVVTTQPLGTAGGILYVFGSNALGELGIPSLGSGTSTPTAINSGATPQINPNATINSIFAGNGTSIVDISVPQTPVPPGGSLRHGTGMMRP